MRRYGASPLHLAAHLALAALSAWVVLQLVGARDAFGILRWFVLALVLHDFVALPLASAFDRLAQRTLRGPAVNVVRVPAAFSVLLLVLFFPAILGSNADSLGRVAGERPDGYLERWLLVTAGLFALSAVVYVVRGRRAAAAASAS